MIEVRVDPQVTTTLVVGVVVILLCITRLVIYVTCGEDNSKDGCLTEDELKMITDFDRFTDNGEENE